MVRDARHLHHHLLGRKRKQRAGSRVIGAGRYELNGICAEERKVADVLVPHSDGPSVVGVGLGTVSKLVPPQRILWLGSNGQTVGCHPGPLGVELDKAEKLANSKEQATVVCTHDRDPCSGRILSRPDDESFCGKCLRGVKGGGQFGLGSAGGLAGKRVDGRAEDGHAGDGSLPSDPAALFGLFDEHLHGYRGFRSRVDYDAVGEVNPSECCLCVKPWR